MIWSLIAIAALWLVYTGVEVDGDKMSSSGAGGGKFDASVDQILAVNRAYNTNREPIGVRAIC